MEQKYYAIISWIPVSEGHLGRFMEIFSEKEYALNVLAALEAGNLIFNAYTIEEWSQEKGWPYPFSDRYNLVEYLFKANETDE